MIITLATIGVGMMVIAGLMNARNIGRFSRSLKLIMPPNLMLPTLKRMDEESRSRAKKMMKAKAKILSDIV